MSELPHDTTPDTDTPPPPPADWQATRLYSPPVITDLTAAPVRDTMDLNQENFEVLINKIRNAMLDFNTSRHIALPSGQILESHEPTVFRTTSQDDFCRVRDGQRIPMDHNGLAAQLPNFIDIQSTSIRNVQGQQVRTPNPTPVPGASLIQAYIQSSGDEIPRLDSITPPPLIYPDAGIRWEEGYDYDTRTYVYHSPDPTDARRIFNASQEWTQLRDDPRALHQRAQDAVERLLSYMTPWTFAYADGPINALMAALTPYVMSMLPDCPTPLFLILSAEPGSGKSTLAKLLMAIASLSNSPTGWAEMLYEGPSHPDTKKSLESAASMGTKALLLDNVKHTLGGGPLESVLTSRTFSYRPFRTQTLRSLPWNTVIMATQNNPDITEDMRRRTFPIHMQKNAHSRSTDLAAAFQQVQDAHNDGTLIIDVLSIIAHWVGNGRPPLAHDPRISTDFIVGTYGPWFTTLAPMLMTALHDHPNRNIRPPATPPPSVSRSSTLDLAMTSESDDMGVELDYLYALLEFTQAGAQDQPPNPDPEGEFETITRSFRSQHLTEALTAPQHDSASLLGAAGARFLAARQAIAALFPKSSSVSVRACGKLLGTLRTDQWVNHAPYQYRLTMTASGNRSRTWQLMRRTPPLSPIKNEQESPDSYEPGLSN